jgi:hypothetical protein
MSVSPTVALRLDPETIERLDDEAELGGHTRSSLARHLLMQGLVDRVRTNGRGVHTEEQSIRGQSWTASPRP